MPEAEERSGAVPFYLAPTTRAAMIPVSPTCFSSDSEQSFISSASGLQHQSSAQQSSSNSSALSSYEGASNTRKGTKKLRNR